MNIQHRFLRLGVSLFQFSSLNEPVGLATWPAIWLKRLSVIGMLLACLSCRAAPEWQQVKGDRFVVLTLGSPKEAAGYARDFSEFIGGLGSVLSIDTQKLPALTLVFLRSPKAYGPYRPLNTSDFPLNVPGYFAQDIDWAITAMEGRWGEGQSAEIMQHEGVHWFLSGLEFDRPLWFEEGLAEVFSTYARHKGKPTFGKPIVSHVDYINQMGFLPLKRIVEVDHRDPLYNQENRRGGFYATAWLFMHYLLFGEHDIPRDALNRYLSALVNGSDNKEQAFRKAFGGDYSALEAALVAYLDKGRFGFWVTAPIAPEKFMASPADPLMVEVALARVALTGRNWALAEKHLARIREIAPEGSPLPHEIAGHIAGRRKDGAALESSFARAAELGSNDVGVFFWPASHILHRSYEGSHRIWGVTGEVTQTDCVGALDLYKKAIEMRPQWRRAYSEFASLIPMLESSYPSSRPLLEQGVTLFPYDLRLHLALAVLDFRDRDLNKAFHRMSDVADRAEATGDSGVKESAREFLDDWRYLDELIGFQEALDKGDIRGARKALDQLAERGVPVRRRHEFTQFQRALAQIEQAHRAAK